MMSELHKAIHELLWSLWSELGVPAGGRHHQGRALDPEPLVVFTPRLASNDARLLGLAFDWCVLHGAQLTKSRISGLAHQGSDAVTNALARFNGDLAKHGVDWTPQATGLGIKAHRQSIPLPVERPALLAFRVRALVGGGVRADVLMRLLFVGSSGLDIGALAPAGATRRSVERVINDLATARHVVALGTGRRRRFRLRDGAALSQLFEARDLTLPDWVKVFQLADALCELATLHRQSASLRRVGAVQARASMQQLATELAIEDPPNLAGREDAFEGLLDWGTRRMIAMAQGELAGWTRDQT